MLLYAAVFIAGALFGAFSHKWLSAEFTKVTGASAQAVATDAVAAAKQEAKKL